MPGCVHRFSRVAIDPSRVDEHVGTGWDLELCRDPASVDRKSDAVDEAGIITGEEDDRRSKFLGLSYATCWC